MRFKVGDRIKIKGLDWYNANKDKYGSVGCFNVCMIGLLGKEVVIDAIVDDLYLASDNGDGRSFYFNECLFEDDVVEPIEEPCEYCCDYSDKTIGDYASDYIAISMHGGVLTAIDDQGAEQELCVNTAQCAAEN